ncbi:mediator complex subunit 13 C-terminal-domain-containing protein [Melanogaster broomeanus]|nr:mediator complex subunit 13 C-terminal-domain-containing protein [Melanogaster broomeanus]
MAHKHDSHASAHSTVSSFSHSSPLVTASDKILSSVISLPYSPQIVYATYVPATDSPSYDVLELGRRHLLSRNRSLSIVESILPHTHVDGDSSALHAFMFASVEGSDASLATLKALSLDGLVVAEISTFDPRGLYPCSSACAEQLSPCPICLDASKPSPTIDSTFSAANLLPRKPLRTIYSRFKEAVRSRLIDDITEASKDAVGGSSAHRLVNGFLLTSSRASNEWGADWLHATRLRQLEVHLGTSRLEVYLDFRPTDYLPLDLNLPSAGGTPLILLPFGVPAYYLSIYNGPTSAVTAQFEESLAGLGAGGWKSSFVASQSEKQKVSRLGTLKRTSPVYIIAWLAVQNKQGEDKGMVIIWPSQLCLSFTASSQSVHARRPLPHLPDLPSQLQPSPPPPLFIPVALSSSSEDNTLAGPTTSILTGRPISRRLCASPTPESLRAFRSLTLSKSSKVDGVASEISVYVESVAKEREKERERIRRERENAQLSASPRAIATPLTTPAPATSSNTPATTFSTTTGHVATAAAPTTSTDTPQPVVATPDTNLPPPNIYYPSPPSTNGKPATQSADSSATPTAPLLHLAPQILQPEPVPIPIASAFDPFGSMDTSWTQPPNDFMNLSIGYDMGFDMNVDTITTRGGGSNTDAGHMNIDFEDGFTFTEDDFDFFDRPSVAARPARPVPSSLEDSSGLTPAAGPAPMGFSPSMFGDGNFSGIAFTPVQQHSSPFTTGGGVDAFTPRFSELHHMHDLVSAGTDILPPSPGATPNSAPATPQVKLSPERKKRPSIPSNFFDPIPFAQSHRLSDSKYDMGKFALPSPPDEEDRTEPIPHLSSPIHISDWKSRYSAATDPRIGVVRKLIGVKRKSFDQGPSRHRLRPSWLQDDEQQEHPVTEDVEDVSDVASDDEDLDGDDAGVPSRATTPAPAYLPLGPTLLHMQFHHPYLLPASKPLRPPGAAIAPMTIPMVIPTSVPTPVSPAAALGAASEKSKSLEAAGSMIAREVVENSVFANAWRTSRINSLPHRHSEVWPADESALAQIICSLPSLEGPVELHAFLQHGAKATSERTLLQRLDAPMLSVGKGDCIVQVLPSSLRFWEKLGLTPRAGKKDLTAFLVFEDNGLSKQQSAENWLKKLSATYNARQLGTHTLGSHSVCSVDGILALRLDSLRKSLISFIADLPGEPAGLVFYIALPDSTLTLASPLLRQLLSAIKRLQKSHSEYPITFQLIPEHLIVAHDLGDASTDFEALCFSVYNRVPQPVGRTMSHSSSVSGRESRRYFREPPYTLARPPDTAVRFSELGPARTLDVLDRHTFLHVGYKFSACGKWLVVSCVDQRGELYDVGSWLTQDEVETSAILQIWNFVIQFARKANVEWRFVISKLGFMSPSELDAWILHLSAASSQCRDLSPFQVSVLSVDQNTSWSFISRRPTGTGQQSPPRRTTGKDAAKSFYMDMTTATTYAIYPTIRIPLPSPPTHNWVDSAFVPESQGATDTSPILPISSNIILHTPLKCTSSYSTLHTHLLYSCKSPGSSLTISDDVIHQEITRNYHELAVLASLQGPFGYPILPLHLAALETMHDALRQEDTE